MRADAVVIWPSVRRRASANGWLGRQSTRISARTTTAIAASAARNTAGPPCTAKVSSDDPFAMTPQKTLVALGRPFSSPGIANADGCQLVCDQVIGRTHCERHAGP